MVFAGEHVPEKGLVIPHALTRQDALDSRDFSRSMGACFCPRNNLRSPSCYCPTSGGPLPPQGEAQVFIMTEGSSRSSRTGSSSSMIQGDFGLIGVGYDYVMSTSLTFFVRPPMASWRKGVAALRTRPAPRIRGHAGNHRGPAWRSRSFHGEANHASGWVSMPVMLRLGSGGKQRASYNQSSRAC